ncbi:MAG: acyloxyacyl hydrolase [Alphaproteobacteria bacterium]|nr:acyloxyacyl hydrolase [Alphaproteobacteria bacterium]
MKSVLLAAVAAAVAIAAPVEADAAVKVDEVRLGVVAHDWGPFTRRKEHGAGVNGEVVFAAPKALKFLGSPRPVIGATIAAESGATNAVYSGLAWRQTIARRYFVEAGAGLAIHDGTTAYHAGDTNVNGTIYLGCRVLFHLSADVGVMVTRRLSASAHVEHMSNAGICADNEGLDNTGVRFGYRF